MAKVMVSLPDELLDAVDAEAARRGTTRSGLLRATTPFAGAAPSELLGSRS
jgi:metal-responsive CopG/Arc/MetJ family transcriptional regulator